VQWQPLAEHRERRKADKRAWRQTVWSLSTGWDAPSRPRTCAGVGDDYGRTLVYLESGFTICAMSTHRCCVQPEYTQKSCKNAAGTLPFGSPMDTYSHLMPGMQQQAVEAIGAALETPNVTP
jgi:hypothetical protein